MDKNKEYTIRACEPEDVEIIVDIEDKYWAGGIRAIFCKYIPGVNDVELCFVAEADAELTGFIYGFVLPQNILIPHFLYVREEFRGKGIARDLLHTLEVESKCGTSQIYYERNLHEYYKGQGYISSVNLEVAIKDLSEERMEHISFDTVGNA